MSLLPRKINLRRNVHKSHQTKDFESQAKGISAERFFRELYYPHHQSTFQLTFTGVAWIEGTVE
jgi:hypothetical protein